MTMVMPNQKVEQPENYKFPKRPSKCRPPESSSKKSNPKPGTLRFKFRVPATVLKSAIAGLSDTNFNPRGGFCLMDVCHDGFELTVYHNRRDPECPDLPDDIVYGFLSLKASGLTDFVCVRPMVKMIPLRGLDDFLQRNVNNDGVLLKVFSFEGSGLVCFRFPRPFFGFQRRRLKHEVRFNNGFTRYHRFPTFSYGFEMSIPTSNLEPLLNNILELLPRRRPPFVSMTIDTKVEIKMGSYRLSVDEQKLVWLLFPYWESLKKVSTLTDTCTVWIGSQPEESVVLRFDLGELGEFMYLKQTPQFFMDKELPAIGTFWPLSSS